MIETDKLIGAISERVSLWKQIKIIKDEHEAKRFAVKVYMEKALGVRVVLLGMGSYSVRCWTRRPYNELG